MNHIDKLRQIHNNFYDYSKSVFISWKDFIIITCPIHGDFKQRYSAHHQGQKCIECIKDKIRKSSKDFIKESNIIHNNKYTYNITEKYIKNIKVKVEIICPLHGKFTQSVECHLTRKQGCSKCRYMLNNKRFSDWIKYRPENPGIFYIIRCYNNEEEFIKVGITTKDSIHSRYGNKRKTIMPYKYEIIKEEKSFDKKYIWDKEILFKKYLSKYHYTPAIEFNGSKTECFKINKYDF